MVDVDRSVGRAFERLFSGGDALCSETSRTLTATIPMFGPGSVCAALVMVGFGDVGSLVSTVKTGETAGHDLFLVLIVFAVFTLSNQGLRTPIRRQTCQRRAVLLFGDRFLRISGLVGYNEVPTWNVYVGTALIAVGAIIMAWRSKADRSSAASTRDAISS